MENTKALVLTAETLELKIGKKSLGQLTTNALDIKAKVEAILPNYDIANYNESNIDSAKKDKALLNASAKSLNDERIKIEKEWMVPFNEFKDVVSATCSLIKSATEKIDVVVKESENKEKEIKRGVIVDYFDNLNFTLVPIEKFFDEKWLNKTVKIKDVQIEINSKVEKINDDISTLEALDGDVETLKAMYLDNLNINETIKYANTIKQNKEKLESIAPAASAPVVTEEENPFTQSEAAPVKEATVTNKVIVTMRVQATYDQLVALSNFMNDNNIVFEKLSNG